MVRRKLGPAGQHGRSLWVDIFLLSSRSARRDCFCLFSTDHLPMKEDSVDYTFLANLQQEFALPEKGILSRVLHKDEHANVTLFGFAAGEEPLRALRPDACRPLFSGRRGRRSVGQGHGPRTAGLLRLYAPHAAPRNRCTHRAAHVAGADEGPAAGALKGAAPGGFQPG